MGWGVILGPRGRQMVEVMVLPHYGEDMVTSGESGWCAYAGVRYGGGEGSGWQDLPEEFVGSRPRVLWGLTLSLGQWVQP